MAEAYRRRLWCSDAIEELEKAARSDAAIADDERSLRIAIACLTPRTREKSIRFLGEHVGAAARPALEEAAASYPNSEVRRGAQVALERLPR
jgi:hypothetical protein